MRWPRLDGTADRYWQSWFFDRSTEPGAPPYAEYGPDADQEKHADMRPWPKPRQRDLWLDALAPRSALK